MNTFSIPHQRKTIDLNNDTLRTLTDMALAKGMNLKMFIEKTLDKMAEDYDDEKAYAWMLENLPEAKEMVSDAEQAEFEEWLGV